MTKLQWDNAGARIYETGVNQGVLYLADGSGVVWNGLTSVQEKSDDVKVTPYYLNGVRYYNDRSTTDYSAVISAYTYPDEFMEFEGYRSPTMGLFFDSQPVYSTFGLSYRSGIGNDLEGSDFGYKIHLVYNITATPSNKNYASQDDSSSLTDFSWDISAVPNEIFGHRPTAHLIIDTRFLVDEAVTAIEDIIYGTEEQNARLPSIQELLELLPEFNVSIVDNGDGTWTATGPGDSIKYVSPTEFEIDWPTAKMINPTTYTLSNSI